MQVVFRADASTTMGSGHIMRCLTLADQLKEKGCSVVFICRDLPGNPAELLQKKGYVLQLLPAVSETASLSAYEKWLGVSEQTDSEQTAQYLHKFGKTDYLVVDSYALSAKWHNRMREFAHNIMVIDDLADRKYDCDVLLDQTMNRAPQDYASLVSVDCTVLAGSEYALLRPQFAAAREQALAKHQGTTAVKQLLVSMGGSDPHNVTGLVLQALELLPRSLMVDVVLAQSYAHFSTVEAQCQRSRHCIHLHSQVQDMADLMLCADLAIGAAGSTAWERCCLGLPSLMLVTADNQNKIAEELQRAGAARALGRYNAIDSQQLSAAIQTLIDDQAAWQGMSNRAAALVDGLGCDRVVTVMQDMAK